MNALENQILQAWEFNHKSNLILIDELTEESLEFTTSKRGGGRIGHQLAHMYNVRFWKTEAADKKLIPSEIETVKSSDEKSLDFLRNLHELSYEWIKVIIESSFENEYKIKWFKRGCGVFVSYLINHETHHRGSIMLTLKLKSFKRNKELKYGIWEWNKI